jgi:predicted nucleotidyltransferase
METLERKGRIRVNRGKLKSFDLLPQNVQENFKVIKNILCELIGSETNVYVFGSFYWGFWDEESDYDILLDYEKNIHLTDKRIPMILEAKKRCKENHGLSVDIMTMKGNGEILIP